MKRREARKEFIRVRYTKDEKEEIDNAAMKAGLMTSEFIRLIIKNAMRDGVKLLKSKAPGEQSLVVSSN